MRIALLTNILTPYRCSFFDKLHELLKRNNGDFRVYVMTESLPLRPWTFQDLSRDYTELLNGYKFILGKHEYLYNHSVATRIRAFKPDAIIVAGSWTYPTTWQLMFSQKLKRICPVFFWTESHNHTGINNKSKSNRFIKWIKQLVLKQFDGFCVPGKFAKENILEQINVGNRQFIQLPNLVDNQYYSKTLEMRKNKTALRKKYQLAPNAFIFFTPARMVEVKGQIPFFSNVSEAVKNKNVTFILAGEGPDKVRIEDIAKQNNLDVRIYSYQNQEEIREWLALTDAFLLPSLSDPNPLSNIEAAWSGLPLCISCYVGNGPELVEDKVNGVVFDTLDKTSVSEKIRFVLNQDNAWFATAGKLSYQKAENDFEATKETEKFIECLEQAVKNFGRGGILG